MEGVHFLWWGFEAIFEHFGNGFVDLVCDALVAEIVNAFLPHGLSQDQNRLDVVVQHN